MSNENEDTAEEAAMRQQLNDLAAKEQAQAVAVEEPTPEPVAAPEPVVTPQAQNPDPVAPNPSPEAEDSLQEYKAKKGFKSEEDVIRSLKSMEQEFHKRNQAGHPGYQDLSNGNPQTPPPPPPQNWQPAPNMNGYPPPNGYGYNPPPPRITREEMTRRLAEKHGMDPEDVGRLAPLMVDLADAIAEQRTAGLRSEVSEVRRQAARSNELMSLAQDPMFTDPLIQKEIREVLKDGSIFQRAERPFTVAYQIASQNVLRQKLQQGTSEGITPTHKPPVTAGGGNGSSQSNTPPVSAKQFDSWTEAEQKAFINSNGAKVPKR